MTFVTYENAGGFLAPERSGLVRPSPRRSRVAADVPPPVGALGPGALGPGTSRTWFVTEGELHVIGFPSRNVICGHELCLLTFPVQRKSYAACVWGSWRRTVHRVPRPGWGAGALRDGRRLTRPLVGTGHFPPSPRDRGKRRIGTDRVACRAWSSAPGVADEAAPLPSGDGDASKALPSFGFCPLLERRPSLAISSSLREKMWYDSDSRDGPGAPRASALLCRHLRVFPADWAHFQCPGPSVDLMNICDGTSAKGESERPIQGTP